jgi:hypothetical protein
MIGRGGPSIRLAVAHDQQDRRQRRPVATSRLGRANRLGREQPAALDEQAWARLQPVLCDFAVDERELSQRRAVWAEPYQMPPPPAEPVGPLAVPLLSLTLVCRSVSTPMFVRIGARPPAARRSGLALPQGTRDPQNPDRATSWPTPGGDRDRVDRATPAASHLDPARATVQAPHDHRGRRCPRARRVLLDDHPNPIATR